MTRVISVNLEVCIVHLITISLTRSIVVMSPVQAQWIAVILISRELLTTRS